LLKILLLFILTTTKNCP